MPALEKAIRHVFKDAAGDLDVEFQLIREHAAAYYAYAVLVSTPIAKLVPKWDLVSRANGVADTNLFEKIVSESLNYMPMNDYYEESVRFVRAEVTKKLVALARVRLKMAIRNHAKI